MANRLDLTGTKRGRLTFTSFSHVKNQSTYWNCICDCGNKTIVKGASKTKSCGCLSLEAKSKNGKKNKSKETPIEYIKNRVKIDKKTKCWVWQKSLIKGYARIGLHKESPLASRYVFKYIKNIDPKNKLVCHKCDNPKCVNPDHLFLGTNKDNFKDMRSKGRSCRGERQWKSKLTEGKVVIIRKSKLPIKYLAHKYRVHRNTIRSIKQRKTWTYL